MQYKGIFAIIGILFNINHTIPERFIARGVWTLNQAKRIKVILLEYRPCNMLIYND